MVFYRTVPNLTPEVILLVYLKDVIVFYSDSIIDI